MIKQEAQGWGAKVIDMLSTDLMKRYGSDSGYSIRNLKYMCQFAVEYPDFPFVQVPLAQITWYHHISMFPKVKDNVLRALFLLRGVFVRITPKGGISSSLPQPPVHRRLLII